MSILSDGNLRELLTPGWADEDYVESFTYRASYEQFAKAFWHTMPGGSKCQWNWHMSFICDELQAVAERVFLGLPKLHDTVINISPGTSKSSLCSVLFPAWVWTRMPTAVIITASHGSALVLDLASKSRDVIRSALYQKLFPEIDIREDTDAKGQYRNKQGGERKVCTVSGMSPIGRHGDIVIIDDPVDPKQVLSEAVTATAKKFITEDIASRVTDKLVTPFFLIMQRLGLQDPTEAMLEQSQKEGAVPVRHISLPADLEKGSDGAWLETDVKPQELAKRYIDGLMDPVRLSREALAPFKARGEAYYSTQFRQKPKSRTAGMFRDSFFNQRVRQAPYASLRVRYWDLAATQDGGCSTAGTLMAKDENAFYIEHCEVGQWETNRRNDLIVAVALRDRVKYGPHHEPIIYIEHEGGSSGKDAFRALARRLAGFRVRPDHPTGKKEVRAESWADACSAGTVYVVDNGASEGTGKATWDINTFIERHCNFPGARQKDEVDSATGAYNLLAERKRPGGMKVYTLGGQHKKMLRIVVTDREELKSVTADLHALLVNFTDPEFVLEEVMEDDDPGEVREARPVDVISNGKGVTQHVGPANSVGLVDVIGTTGQGGAPSVPEHALTRLLGSLTLSFADIDPSEYQDVWDVPLPAYGKTPPEVIMSRDDGKKFWSFLTRKRDPGPEIFVFVDDGQGRALSAALAVCEIMALPKSQAIWIPGVEADNKNDQGPPNPHVYAMVKSTRGMVV